MYNEDTDILFFFIVLVSKSLLVKYLYNPRMI
jgi:hypothetical protein